MVTEYNNSSKVEHKRHQSSNTVVQQKSRTKRNSARNLNNNSADWQ